VDEGVVSCKWAIDSGASHHICKDRSKFVKFKEKIYPSHITVANAGECKILGGGIVEERMIQVDWSIRIAKIENVLYIPSMKKNLLSIPQLRKKFVTIFEGERIKIVSKLSGKCIAPGELENGLYWLKTFSQQE